MSTLVKNNPLAKAIKYALLAGASATVLTSPMAFAAEEGAEEDEKVTVTGSRIKRTDIEGALPVTVIDREQIDLSGQTNVADLLRNTSFNSFGSTRPQSGNSAQSFAGMNLRGLGSGRTLLLVDGKRLPKSANVGSAANLNAVPLAAVEKIEILSDGASAVYGSDAMGGVVNIITRKDFDGAELRYGKSDPSRKGGGGREELSAVVGISGDQGSMTAGFSTDSRDIIWARDREWSSGGFSTYGANWYNVTTTDEGPAEGSFVAGNDATCDGNVGFSQSSPGGFCRYEYSLLSADEADTKNTSMFVRSTYDINEDTSLYFNTSVSRIESFGRYAPSLASMLVDADSPNNPYDTDMFLRHRFAGLGTRDTYIQDTTYDTLIGFEMDLSDSMTLDMGLRTTENKYDEFGYNYVVIPIAQQYMDDGTYDLANPYDVDPMILNSMKATITRDGYTTGKEIYGSITFDIMEMDAGTASGVFGAEYQDRDYQDKYDSLSEGGVIGGSAGNSAGGGRSVKAAYFEGLFPLTEMLELNVAGRFESYSDYGNDFAPKVSVRFQPMDELTLRASYGTGFRAPSLDILTMKPTFSASATSDFDTCLYQNDGDGNCTTQINNWSIANPNLESEESDQFAFGVAWAPMDEVSVSLDYYNIDISNRIKFFSTGTLLSNDARGIPNPAGLGVTRIDATCNDGSGGTVACRPITRVDSGYGNEGTVETNGFDLNVKTKFDLPGDITMMNNLQWGYVNSYKIEGVELIGTSGAPEMRGNIQSVFAWNDLSFAWNLNYIHSYEEDRLEPYVEFGYSTAVPSWITHDIQLSYDLESNTKIAIGATNVADKDPNLNLFELRGYIETLYDGYGRQVYLRVSQAF